MYQLTMYSKVNKRYDICNIIWIYTYNLSLKNQEFPIHINMPHYRRNYRDYSIDISPY